MIYYPTAATRVLLHATACAENWSFTTVSTRDTILHLLRSTERRVTSLRGTRVIHERMEISWWPKTLVQESWSGWWHTCIVRRATVSLLWHQLMGKTVIQWQHEPKCYCWVLDRRRCTGEISEYVMGAIESESPTLGFSFSALIFGLTKRGILCRTRSK